MWLFAAFVIVPLVEIALFIQVGGAIGLWPTLGVVVLTAIIGTTLMRTQGAAALARIRAAFDRLEDPSRPLADGAMILVAGAVLLTPGFFTDAVGLLLLVPNIRAMLFQFALRRLAASRARHQPRSASTVIDGDFQPASPSEQDTPPSGWTRH